MFNLKNNPALLDNQKPKIIFMRHAEKAELTEGGSDVERDITTNGKIQSQDFAMRLATHSLRITKIISSDVKRCEKTAEIIQNILNQTTIEYSALLGNPGAYVANDILAAQVFEQYSMTEVIAKLHQGDTLNGLNSLKQGSLSLLKRIKSDLEKQQDTIIYMSHDVILASFISTFLEKPIDKNSWIDYLGGFVIELSTKNEITIILSNQIMTVNLK